MNSLDRGIALHTHRALGPVAPTLSVEPPEWTLSAVCASVDPDLFYVGQGGSPIPAKEICSGCDVRGECLAWIMGIEGEQGVNYDYRWGVFGGLTARERAALARNGWRPADPTPPVRLPSRHRGVNLPPLAWDDDGALDDPAAVPPSPQGSASAGLDETAVEPIMAGTLHPPWAAEPDVGRVADGVSSRVDPQVAEYVGWLIIEHAEQAVA